MSLQIILITLVLGMIFFVSPVQAEMCNSIENKGLYVFVTGDSETWKYTWDGVKRQMQRTQFSDPDWPNVSGGPSHERSKELPQVLAGLKRRLDRPFAISRNGLMLIAAIHPDIYAIGASHEFVLIDLKKNHLQNTFKSDFNVESVSWSPSDQYFAVLLSENITEKVWKGPIELLRAAMGHPVQYSTLYIAIYTSDGQPVCMELLKEKVPYGRGYIEWK